MKSLLAGFKSHFYVHESKPDFLKNVFQYKVLFYNAKWNRNIPRSMMFIILCKETVRLRNNIRIKA